jgi:hypothetical protein
MATYDAWMARVLTLCMVIALLIMILEVAGIGPGLRLR